MYRLYQCFSHLAKIHMRTMYYNVCISHMHQPASIQALFHVHLCDTTHMAYQETTLRTHIRLMLRTATFSLTSGCVSRARNLGASAA